MPSQKTIGKAVTEQQHEAFEEACRKAGLEKSAALMLALKQFCETQSIQWPEGHTHGGDRKSMTYAEFMKANIENDCKRYVELAREVYREGYEIRLHDSCSLTVFNKAGQTVRSIYRGGDKQYIQPLIEAFAVSGLPLTVKTR